jgi:hypothetical protein
VKLMWIQKKGNQAYAYEKVNGKNKYIGKASGGKFIPSSYVVDEKLVNRARVALHAVGFLKRIGRVAKEAQKMDYLMVADAIAPGFKFRSEDGTEWEVKEMYGGKITAKSKRLGWGEFTVNQVTRALQVGHYTARDTWTPKTTRNTPWHYDLGKAKERILGNYRRKPRKFAEKLKEELSNTTIRVTSKKR